MSILFNNPNIKISNVLFEKINDICKKYGDDKIFTNKCEKCDIHYDIDEMKKCIKCEKIFICNTCDNKMSIKISNCYNCNITNMNNFYAKIKND